MGLLHTARMMLQRSQRARGLASAGALRSPDRSTQAKGWRQRHDALARPVPHASKGLGPASLPALTTQPIWLWTLSQRCRM